jgi:hypothetical protein
MIIHILPIDCLTDNRHLVPGILARPYLGFFDNFCEILGVRELAHKLLGDRYTQYKEPVVVVDVMSDYGVVTPIAALQLHPHGYDYLMSEFVHEPPLDIKPEHMARLAELSGILNYDVSLAPTYQYADTDVPGNLTPTCIGGACVLHRENNGDSPQKIYSNYLESLPKKKRYKIRKLHSQYGDRYACNYYLTHKDLRAIAENMNKWNTNSDCDVAARSSLQWVLPAWLQFEGKGDRVRVVALFNSIEQTEMLALAAFVFNREYGWVFQAFVAKGEASDTGAMCIDFFIQNTLSSLLSRAPNGQDSLALNLTSVPIPGVDNSYSNYKRLFTNDTYPCRTALGIHTLYDESDGIQPPYYDGTTKSWKENTDAGA